MAQTSQVRRSGVRAIAHPEVRFRPFSLGCSVSLLD